MAEKTTVVRARTTEKDARLLARLAKQRGETMSDVIRDLVHKEAERRRADEQMRPYSYLAEKVGQALHILTFRDDVATTVQAFATVGRALDHNLPAFPEGSVAAPDRWLATIRETLTPTPEDEAHPRYKEAGGYEVIATRMTRDEKTRFARALLDLDSYFRGYR